jgi:hypothetical protein
LRKKRNYSLRSKQIPGKKNSTAPFQRERVENPIMKLL